MKAHLLQKPLNGSNSTVPVSQNLPQDSKYQARLRLKVWDLNSLQQTLFFYSTFERHLADRGPALQRVLRALAPRMKGNTHPRESFVGVSEELRPFDRITFRINFNFSFLNLHYFRGKKKRENWLPEKISLTSSEVIKQMAMAWSNMPYKSLIS